MVKELRTDKFIVLFGSSLNIFGVGITISRWSIDLTLGFLWLSIEW
jgi:hypothetical protein